MPPKKRIRVRFANGKTGSVDYQAYINNPHGFAQKYPGSQVLMTQRDGTQVYVQSGGAEVSRRTGGSGYSLVTNEDNGASRTQSPGSGGRSSRVQATGQNRQGGQSGPSLANRAVHGRAEQARRLLNNAQKAVQAAGQGGQGGQNEQPSTVTPNQVQSMGAAMMQKIADEGPFGQGGQRKLNMPLSQEQMDRAAANLANQQRTMLYGQSDEQRYEGAMNRQREMDARSGRRSPQQVMTNERVQRASDVVNGVAGAHMGTRDRNRYGGYGKGQYDEKTYAATVVNEAGMNADHRASTGKPPVAGTVVPTAETRAKATQIFDEHVAEQNNWDEAARIVQGMDLTGDVNSVLAEGEKRAQAITGSVSTTSSNPLGATIKSVYEANKEIDPNRLSEELGALFRQHYIQYGQDHYDEIKAAADRRGMDVDDFFNQYVVREMSERQQGLLHEALVQREIPKGKADAMLKSVMSNVLGSAFTLAVTTPAQRQIRGEAMSRNAAGEGYQMSGWEQATATGIGLAMDAPTLMGTGALGEGLTASRAATARATARMLNGTVGQRLFAGVGRAGMSSAINLGTYNGLSTIIGNAAMGEGTTPMEFISSVGGGAVTGAVLGFTGRAYANATFRVGRGSSGLVRGSLKRASVWVGGKAVETMAFFGSGAMNGEEVSLTKLMEDAEMVIMMGLTGAPFRSNNVGAAANFLRSPRKAVRNYINGVRYGGKMRIPGEISSDVRAEFEMNEEGFANIDEAIRVFDQYEKEQEEKKKKSDGKGKKAGDGNNGAGADEGADASEVAKAYKALTEKLSWDAQNAVNEWLFGVRATERPRAVTYRIKEGKVYELAEDGMVLAIHDAKDDIREAYSWVTMKQGEQQRDDLARAWQQAQERRWKDVLDCDVTSETFFEKVQDYIINHLSDEVKARYEVDDGNGNKVIESKQLAMDMSDEKTDVGKDFRRWLIASQSLFEDAVIKGLVDEKRFNELVAKRPEDMTQADIALMKEIYNRCCEISKEGGKLVVGTAREEGRDLAKNAGVGTNTPDTAALESAGKALDEAVKGFNDFLGSDTEVAGELDSLLPPGIGMKMEERGTMNDWVEAYMALRESGYTDERLAPILRFMNAKSFQEGLVKGCAEQIDEAVNFWGEKVAYTGDDGTQMVHFCQDENGKIWYIKGGKFDFDANTKRITTDEVGMIFVDEEGNFRNDPEGMTYVGGYSLDEAKATKRQELEDAMNTGKTGGETGAAEGSDGAPAKPAPTENGEQGGENEKNGGNEGGNGENGNGENGQGGLNGPTAPTGGGTGETPPATPPAGGNGGNGNGGNGGGGTPPAGGTSGVRIQTERHRKFVEEHIEGDTDELVTPDGEEIEGTYYLVEQDALTPSHDPAHNFAQTEGFPTNPDGGSINDRAEYGSAETQTGTKKKAAGFDQRASQEMIVCWKNGNVMSGNDRTQAGQIAAAEGTDGKYVDYLKRHAKKYGFTAEQVASMSHPRVVFVPKEDMPETTKTMARWNNAYQKRQNWKEAAVKASKLLREDERLRNQIGSVIAKVENLSDLYGNVALTKEMLDILEKGGMITDETRAEWVRDGMFSAIGKEHFETILMGSVLGENSIRLMLSEGMGNVRQNIVYSIVALSKNVGLGDYSLVKEFETAIDFIAKAKNKKTTVRDYIRELDMFETLDDGLLTSLMLAEQAERLGPRKFKAMLESINTRFEDAARGQGDLFGDTSKEALVGEVLKQLGYDIETIKNYYEKRRRHEKGQGGTDEDGGGAGGHQGDAGEGGNGGTVPGGRLRGSTGGVDPLGNGTPPADPSLAPRNDEERKIVSQVEQQLAQEISEQEELLKSAKSALEKATAKLSGKRDMFGDDDALNQPGQLFGNSEMGYDNSDEAIRQRTQKERAAVAEAERRLATLKSKEEHDRRIRGALESNRRQTRLDFGEEGEGGTLPGGGETPEQTAARIAREEAERKEKERKEKEKRASEMKKYADEVVEHIRENRDEKAVEQIGKSTDISQIAAITYESMGKVNYAFSSPLRDWISSHVEGWRDLARLAPDEFIKKIGIDKIEDIRHLQTLAETLRKADDVFDTAEFRKAIGKVSDGLRKRVKAEVIPKIKGGKATLDEVEKLYRALMSGSPHEDIQKLADRVFGLLRGLDVEIEFTNNMRESDGRLIRGTSTKGTNFGNKIYYRLQYVQGKKGEYATDERVACTLLHELIHNATTFMLNIDKYPQLWGEARATHLHLKEIRQAVKNLNDIYNTLKSDRSGVLRMQRGRGGSWMYGMTSVSEMVAEMANPHFREQLKKVNLWKKLKDSVLKLIGIKTEGGSDAERALSKALDDLLDQFDEDLWKEYSSKVRERHPNYFERSEVEDSTLSRHDVTESEREEARRGIESLRERGADVDAKRGEAGETDGYGETGMEDAEGAFSPHIVEDAKEIERLDSEKTEKGYRTVALNPDGTLGSPMADRLGKKGNKATGEAGERKATTPFEYEKWERSDEHPELATDEGKIDLVKPGDLGTVGAVDYNPYIHIRPDKVNTQFKNAWERDNLVYIETLYPASELDRPYKAEKAKKSVGKHKWNGGWLILSRWDKPMRQVPWEEVADDWEALSKKKKKGFHFDVIPPQLLPILAERGVEILPPHKNMGVECEEAYRQWREGEVEVSYQRDEVSELGGGPQFSIDPWEKVLLSKDLKDFDLFKKFDVPKRITSMAQAARWTYNTLSQIRGEANRLYDDKASIDFTSGLLSTDKTKGREIRKDKAEYYRDRVKQYLDFIQPLLAKARDNSTSKEAREYFENQIEEANYARQWYDRAAKGDASVLEEPTPLFQKDEVKELGGNDVFYSNAKRAVEGIKQEKAKPAQWLAMIQKAGGLKAGEDKWLGLSDWLESKGNETVTKKEVLEYIGQNEIQMEEVGYQDGTDFIERFSKAFGMGYVEEYDGEGLYIADLEKAVALYNEHNKDKITIKDGELSNEDKDKLLDWAEGGDSSFNRIEGIRLGYTTEGLDDKREIAFTVPAIEPWRSDDDVHFGDAGKGRAVMWVRFGETTDAGGKKVLVIDEIQSNRHQEGREKGYSGTKEDKKAWKDYEGHLKEKYGDDWVMKGTDKEIDEYERLERQAFSSHGTQGIPSAPFEKNWHEVALKRMLRYAAENGYDKVAWTTGGQQAERYSLKHVLDGDIVVWTDPHPIPESVEKNAAIKEVTLPIKGNDPITVNVNRAGVITGDVFLNRANLRGKHLSDVVGTQLAKEIMGMKPGTETITAEEMTVGGEGMEGFYDEILPRYMNKYGKKWGAKVSELDLSHLPDKHLHEGAGGKMWSVDVTPEMKESVMEGQPLFQRDEVRELDADPMKTVERIAREERERMDDAMGSAGGTGTYGKANDGENGQNGYNGENGRVSEGDAVASADAWEKAMHGDVEMRRAVIPPPIGGGSGASGSGASGSGSGGSGSGGGKRKVNAKPANYGDLTGAEQRNRYEQSVRRGWWKEAWVDGLRALQEIQKALTGVKKDLQMSDAHNAYRKMLHVSSVIRAAQDKMTREYVEPLQKAMNACMRRMAYHHGDKGWKFTLTRGLWQNKRVKHKAYEDVKTMVWMKSGLERNRVLWWRDLGKLRFADEGNLPAEAQTIYWNMYNNTNFTGMDPLQAALKKQELRDAAYMEWYNDRSKEWQQERARLLRDLRSGVIDLYGYYRGMDDFLKPLSDECHKAYEPGSKDTDYSGLNQVCGGFDPSSGKYDEDDVISQLVNAEHICGKNNVDALWERIRSLSYFSLRKEYDSGLISKANHDHVANMMDWYVPMREWNEEMAEDRYSYLTNSMEKGAGKLTVHKEAGGRWSMPDDPFAWLLKQADSSVVEGETNKVRQAFLRLCEATSDFGEDALVSRSRIWEVKDGTDPNGLVRWKTVWCETEEGWTARQVAQAVTDFNNQMEALRRQGDARLSKGGVTLPIRFKKTNHKNEHAVEVRLNGQSHILYINGSPRAAQALNGFLNAHDEGGIMRGLSKMNRWIAASYTSWSPKFILRNTVRDLDFAGWNVYAKEGANYTRRFLGNWSKNLNPAGGLRELFKKYEAGTLDTTKKRERYFQEFMDNGGKTGYVAQKQIEEYKQDVQGALETGDARKAMAKGVKAALGMIEAFNQYAENMARFATYCTSRNSGRSILRSIADAKDASTNFNRKGAGWQTGKDAKSASQKAAGFTAEFARKGWIFMNPGIQSLSILKDNFKEHPVRSTVGMTAHFLLSAAWPAIVGWWLYDVLGEDEDDPRNDYANLNEWDRRSGLCIPLTHGKWVKLPLGIEPGAAWAMGQLFGSWYLPGQEDCRSTLNPVMDFSSALTSLSPVDPLASDGKNFISLMPTLTQPVLQNLMNQKWTGAPIERDQSFWDKGAPRWTRAFNSTPEFYVNICKMLTQMTNGGGNPSIEKGVIDLSPGQMQNFVKGYIGGPGDFVGDVASMVQGEFKPRRIPIFNGVLSETGHEQEEMRINTRWYKLRDEMSIHSNELKKYQKLENDGDMSWTSKRIALEDKWGEKLAIWKEYANEVKRLEGISKSAVSEEEREMATYEAMRLKKEAVREIEY